MISPRLQRIFGLSIPLFIVHGVEEFVTHFSDIDAHDQAIFGILSGLSNHGATFVTFQVMLWLLLLISFLLLLGPKWQFSVLALVGVIYLYELHHIYKAIMIWGYYPGLITSLAFPVFAFFFWKEWIRIYKKT